MKYNKKFVINERIVFSPADNKLTPLVKTGKEVLLHVPVSRMLLLLLQKEGEVVNQEEIYREVWEKHQQKVTSNTLYQNVSLLRKSLIKAGEIKQTIKTYPKTGIKFYGKVQIIDDDRVGMPESAHLHIKPPATEAPEAASVKENASTGESKKRSNLVKAMILIVLLGLLSLSFFHFFPSKKEFEHTQAVVAHVNNCPIYVGRLNRDVDMSKVSEFLKEKGIHCDNDELLYLTKLPNTQHISIMLCNTKLNGLNCKLEMTAPLYLTK